MNDYSNMTNSELKAELAKEKSNLDEAQLLFDEACDALTDAINKDESDDAEEGGSGYADAESRRDEIAQEVTRLERVIQSIELALEGSDFPWDGQ